MFNITEQSPELSIKLFNPLYSKDYAQMQIAKLAQWFLDCLPDTADWTPIWTELVSEIPQIVITATHLKPQPIF